MKRPKSIYGLKQVTGTHMFEVQSSSESTFKKIGKAFIDNTLAGFGIVFAVMSPVWAQIIVNLAFHTNVTF